MRRRQAFAMMTRAREAPVFITDPAEKQEIIDVHEKEQQETQAARPETPTATSPVLKRVPGRACKYCGKRFKQGVSIHERFCEARPT